MQIRGGRALIACAIVAAAAAVRPALADEMIDIAWAPASGSPDGYQVAISWNGGPVAFYDFVGEPAISIPVRPGDRLAIQVRAQRHDANGDLRLGPWSPLSEEIRVPVVDPLEPVGFDDGAAGFAYADDVFRQTDAADYTDGSHASDAGFDGAGLRLDLGGVDAAEVLGMSGGWSRSFSLAESALVTIALRVRIAMSEQFEPDECAEALLAVNGVPVGIAPDDFLLRVCGGSAQGLDTGWQLVSVDVPLASGAHTLELGGHLGKKTSVGEVASLFFDDVSVSFATGALSFEPQSLHVGAVPAGFAGVVSRDVALDAVGAPATGVSITSDSPWLAASPASATIPATLRVDVDPSALAVGTHVATLTATGPGLQTATLPVEISVYPGGVFAAHFDSGPDGFAYSDDAFLDTQEPDYADGWFASDGGFTGGGLLVDLGGIDREDVSGMSGAFARDFQVLHAGDYEVRLRTRMWISGAYEEGECSQLLIAVDGVLEGHLGEAHRVELCGEPTPSVDGQDTGWVDETLVLFLEAGDHVLEVGGYTSGKTYDDEITQVLVDDVVVEAYGALPEPGAAPAWAAGACLLAVLARRRRSR